MRTCVGVWLIAVCLGLTGCIRKSPKPNGTAPGPAPFPTARSSDQSASAITDIPEPTGDALLAGQVQADLASRTPSRIVITVTDLETKTAAAPIDYEVNNPDGQFTIMHLKAGHHYKLAVKAQEGDRILTALCFVKPPNPRVLIHLRPDPSAGPMPPGPRPLEKSRRKPEQKRPPEPDPPPTDAKTQNGGEIKGENKSASSSGDSTGASAQPVPKNGSFQGADPSLIGLNPNQHPSNGFNRAPESSRDATLNINGGVSHTPAPSSFPDPPRRPEAPPPLAPVFEAPTAAGASALPGMSTGPAEIPSCVMPNSQTLVNFALRDQEGRPWEFRNNRTGRLLVVCFWSVDCVYCPPTLRYAAELERTYRAYGVQAVGIVGSSEPWTPEQIHRVQAKKVSCNAREMTTLLAGGSARPCPIQHNLHITGYPTVVVIAVTPQGQGTILWRYSGDSPDKRAALGQVIYQWVKKDRARAPR